MSLAEKLLVEFSADIEGLTLVPGMGGVFDVRVGGEIVYSKHNTNRFPTDEDTQSIMTSIRQQA